VKCISNFSSTGSDFTHIIAETLSCRKVLLSIYFIADCSPPAGPDIKKGWSFTSAPPICLHDVDWENFSFNTSKLFRSLSANFWITAVFLKPTQPSAALVTGRKSFDQKRPKIKSDHSLVTSSSFFWDILLHYWVTDARSFGTSWLSHIRGLHVQKKDQ
jgi:hypothetical protein